MKIRVFHRLTSAIVALVLIALALLLAGVAWNIIKQSDVSAYVDAFYNVKINSWILTGGACLSLLFAIALLFITFGTDRKVNRFLDIGTEESGAIRIADTTFKEMVNKNAKAVAGVIDSKCAIKCEDKNVSVIIKAQLEDDVVIPSVCAEVQNQVKTNLEAMSGITISKVNVLVENKPKE